MTSSAMRGFRRGMWLAATGIIFAAGPVRAQDSDEPAPEPQHSRLPSGAVVQPLDTGPGGELRRNLSMLAENPRSLEALLGAGRAAIALGDGESASGFFTRAQEIAPDDPRVRAGLASAMLYSARPEQALILFAEAVQHGASEAELAGDRGLAYDLVGDPRHAQQDYALALRRRNDPEIERRLALSLAISGQRDAALRVIDAQLRRQDRAAWRTQAFVLALTGDAAGANDTARRVLPTPNAEALAPFFARLPSLSPAQKAAAVNFGRFPSDGRATRFASNTDTSADPGALAMAQGGPRMRAPLAEPVDDTPRRRPGQSEDQVAGRRMRLELAPAPQPRPTQYAQSQTSRFAPAPAPDNGDADQSDEDARQAESQQQRAPAGRPREAPAFVAGGNFTLDTSHEQRIPAPAPPPAPSATPGFGPAEQIQAPPLQRFQPAPAQTQSAPARQEPGFSDIAHVVYSLPGERREPAAVPLTPAERQARDAAAREAEARYRGGAAPSSSPSRGSGARYWVQIAHGGVRQALALQYRQVHAQAPGLVESHPAWTVADRATNRLLIGPFDDERGAQAFIDQLGARHIAALPWASAAGQSVERLQGGVAAPAASAHVRETPAEHQAAGTRRGRQALAQDDSSDDRHGARSRSGRGATAFGDCTPARTRSGRGAAAACDDRTSSHGRSDRGASASGDCTPAHGRAGRRAASACEDRSSSHGRAGRATASDDRGNSHARSGHGRQSDDENQSSRGRSGGHRGASDNGNSSSHARPGHGRAAADDDNHTSRNRSSQERRSSAHDTRNNRGRSGEEQRPAPSRRRSH